MYNFSSSMKYVVTGFLIFNSTLPSVAQSNWDELSVRVCSGEIQTASDISVALQKCSPAQLNEMQIRLVSLKEELRGVERQLNQKDQELKDASPSMPMIIAFPTTLISAAGVALGFGLFMEGGGASTWSQIENIKYMESRGIPPKYMPATLTVAGLVTMAAGAGLFYIVHKGSEESKTFGEIRVIKHELSKIQSKFRAMTAEIEKRERIVALMVQTQNLKR